MVDHVKDITTSTAVYIGKVVNPKKAIKDGDDDNAHIDVNAQPEIQFMHSSSDHQFMVDKILKQEEGITYSLFQAEEKPDEEEEAPEEEDEEDEEGEKKPKVKKPEVEKLPRHALVEEVVREPKIHFYTVPRLGSYLAIKLEFSSCLFEEAFDAAVVEYQEVENRKNAQDAERKEWEEAQAQLKAEKEEAGEEWEAEEREWAVVEPAPFMTKKIQYCVCLNTMGQDRQYSEEEKLAALRTVQEYRDRWEALEKENLANDVKAKLERSEYFLMYRDNQEPVDAQELEKIVSDAIDNEPPVEGMESLSEGEKVMVGLKARFQTCTRGFHAPDLVNTGKVKSDYQSEKKSHKERTGSAMGSVMSGEQSTHYIPLAPEQWQEKVRELKSVCVMKYPKIWQSLFYLMRYQDREDVCERGTNRLLWKQCKMFINDDLFAKMGDFWPPGPKEDQYKAHEQLKFIQGCLNEYDLKDVEDYSIALGKIYRWISLAIELRKEDVRQRRETKAILDQERA